jgi:desulfoferrodoxin (superoxide reductase-like protein)
MRRAIQLFLLASLLGMAAPCRADDSELELTISIPHPANELPHIRWVEKGMAEKPHFHLVLRNMSKEPQEVLMESLPVIEFTNAAGMKWTARAQQLAQVGSSFRDSGGQFRKLQPGECMVFDIYLSRSKDMPGCLYFDPQPPRGKLLLWANIPGIDDLLLGANSGIMAKPVECIVE